MLTFPITFNSGNRFTNYDVWNFEDSLASNTGLIWNRETSGSPSYLDGKLNRSINPAYNSSTNYKITNPGSRFIWTFSQPFAFSMWQKNSATTGAGTSIALSHSGSLTSSALLARIYFTSNFIEFNNYYTTNTSAVETYTYSYSSLGTDWNFYYFFYNPSESRKVYFGYNDSTPVSYTFTNDLDSTSYTNTFSLILGRNTSNTNTVNMDQIIIWHTTARNHSDMLAVYNSGNGITL